MQTMSNATEVRIPRQQLWLLRPEMLEWVFTLAVLAFLLTQAAGFRDSEFIRASTERYQDAVQMRVVLNAQAAGTGRVLNICRHFGGWLPEAERKPAANLLASASLLGASAVEPSNTGVGDCDADSRHPLVLTAAEEIDNSVAATLSRAYDALQASIALPVTAKLAQLAELENRAREARAETDVRGAMENLDAETSGYREAYGIAGQRSLPLACAWNHAQSGYQSRDAADNAGRVRSLLALAALVDGDAARAAAAAKDGAAWLGPELDAGCGELGTPQIVVKRGAELVAKARASDNSANKSAAMQALLTRAPWYFAAWAVLGLVLLQIGRRSISLCRTLPLAVLLWSLAGWATQVHVEWLDDKSAHTAWLLKWGARWPEVFQLAAAASAIFLLLSLMLPVERWLAAARPPAQAPSSRVGYAGFVLFVGLGWWLLLDLSAAGYYSNRFHGLYQQVYVFAAFALLTLLPPLRLAFAHRLTRWFGRFLLLARPRAEGLARALPWLMYLGAAAVVLALAAIVHQHQTQLTSELFRLWLIFGVSWFFLLRGDAALSLVHGGAGGHAGRGQGLRGVVFILPLLFAVAIPLLGLVLTDDFGPLMVMLYAASIFVGAGVAFAFVDRAGYRPWLGTTVGIAVAGAWVYFGTLAMFTLPAPAARIVERLASMRDPFTAANDQMAIITWFQESAPPGGYGLGAVPWCGEILHSTCRGVPKQIQSDYVFTALVGAFGKTGAVAVVALLAFWLVRLVAQHGRATRGMVSLDSALATQQAWLSWIAVCWVGLTLAQLAITVAGNLAWLPLTGITFPFASFGVWSLLVNTFFLSLAINLPRMAK